MSGQGKYRDLWQQYYETCDGIVFVVDAADELRIKVAKNELDMLLQNYSILKKEIPILIYANKMDLDAAMGSEEVCALLELENITNRPWSI